METAPAATPPILEIDGLQTTFHTRDGVVRAEDGVSCRVHRGEVLAVVGESGCGKSVTALSVLRLIPSPPGRIEANAIRLDGVDLLELSPQQMQGIRGNEISMIFQEPMTSLNPVLTVGRLELIRFCGHPDTVVRRCSDVEETTAVRAGVPAPVRRAGFAVELFRAGRTVKELAREFECSASAIRNWVRQADRDQGRREDGLTSSDLEELRRLRRELRRVREERDILAKATAWFARETGSVPGRSSGS